MKIFLVDGRWFCDIKGIQSVQDDVLCASAAFESWVDLPSFHVSMITSRGELRAISLA